MGSTGTPAGSGSSAGSVPGQCPLKCASRRMPQAADRQAFARVVRIWQYAAYAERLPDDDEFEALLGELQQRYGWAS